MKEAYRLKKNEFYSLLAVKNKKVILAFLYTGKKAENYDLISASVNKLLISLSEK